MMAGLILCRNAILSNTMLSIQRLSITTLSMTMWHFTLILGFGYTDTLILDGNIGSLSLN